MVLQKNPLLIDIPLHRVFSCLCFSDIKSCRLVCHQWNRISSSFFGPRSLITFNSKSQKVPFTPITFLDQVLKECPSFVFTSFKFEDTWDISEINLFFQKWGKNVCSINFRNISLKNESGDLEPKRHISRIFYASPLKELKTLSCDCELEVSMDILILKSIPYIELCRTSIIISEENYGKRIIPLEISLNGISFKEKGKVLKNVAFDTFFDFSKAKKIFITIFERDSEIFDLSNDIFNAECIHLENYSRRESHFINWEGCKGNVNFLLLDCINDVEANHLNIKQLVFFSANINLNALPKSIEKIHIHDGFVIICNAPIEFPKLNYLCLSGYPDTKYSDVISHFKYCENLLDLEFNVCNPSSESKPPWDLNFQSIPKSVKRLKISRKFNIVYDGNGFRADTLILKDVFIDVVVQMISKVKPTVFVLSLTEAPPFEEIFLSKFQDLLIKNLQLEKIAFGIHATKCYSLITRTCVSSMKLKEFKTLEHLEHLDEPFHPGSDNM